MNSLTKIVLITFMLGIVALELMPSGWTYPDHKNSKKSKILSQQDKTSIATIERQEADGHLTSSEVTMEKDSVVRDHSLKF